MPKFCAVTKLGVLGSSRPESQSDFLLDIILALFDISCLQN